MHKGIETEIGMKYHPKLYLWPDRIYAQGDWNYSNADKASSNTLTMTRPHICTRGLKQDAAENHPDIIYSHDPTAYMHKGIETKKNHKCTSAFFDEYDPTAYMHKGIETFLIQELFALSHEANDPTAYMHKGIETELLLKISLFLSFFSYDPTAYMHKGIETMNNLLPPV